MASGTTNFPTSLDSNAVADNTTQVTSTGYNNHSVQIEALEAKVGADSSAVTTSHDYKLSAVTGSNKALSNAAGAVTPASLVSGTGSTWVWQTWTPTWTNLTKGNGTEDIAKYIQIGKLVIIRYKFTFGSTSAMGTAPTFTLPVTAVSDIDTTNNIIGTCSLVDPDTVTVQGFVLIPSTTTGILRVAKSDGTYLQHASVTATVPHTWGNLDRVHFQGYYEAA